MNKIIVICSYCQSEAKFVTGQDIYPHRPDLFHLRFWQCKPCDAYAGDVSHKDYVKNPVVLANKPLRNARMSAHSAFDKLWRSGEMTRSGAYKWLSDATGIPPEKCHIGMMDVTQAKQVVQAVLDRHSAQIKARRDARANPPSKEELRSVWGD